MSKRRLKTILDLSCGNSGKTNTNLEKNINHGNQTFKDFLSAAEFVFEDFESDLVNLGNVNVVQNNVNNIMLQTENIFEPDNTQYYVENSDGCGYQNKNIIMSNALLQFCKNQNVTIEQKFLIKGHTQMECDSAHSMIERKLHNKDIFLPSDYVRITTEARKFPNSYEAVLLKHDYFYDFKPLKEYTSIRPGIGKGEPEVKDIRALLYDPSSFKIYYKLLFNEPYCEIPKKIIRKKINQNLSIEGETYQFQKLYKNPLPLTKSKWNDLQKLKQFMPIDTHSFYDTLPHLNTFKTKAAKI
ncbi:uncharacterized protein LOC132927581 [Rhopalosiphum padi]|uniref:uncharacterized protein LOC132927581 n=1 Tax=Rhopalosiphum padi TaxID=40932 RepID=UPI00298EA01E|nr:uncharacterized protein LOC132927581 [Rhopalosiphum padi]